MYQLKSYTIIGNGFDIPLFFGLFYIKILLMKLSFLSALLTTYIMQHFHDHTKSSSIFAKNSQLFSYFGFCSTSLSFTISFVFRFFHKAYFFYNQFGFKKLHCSNRKVHFMLNSNQMKFVQYLLPFKRYKRKRYNLYM